MSMIVNMTAILYRYSFLGDLCEGLVGFQKVYINNSDTLLIERSQMRSRIIETTIPVIHILT
jgi:hypothetical protein